jgi:hypothetical protein
VIVDERTLPGEAERWHELHSLIDELDTHEAERPGYFAEGWTAKDVVAHLGTWMAEGAAVLSQIRAGTYVEGELDIDEANARFFDAMHDIPLPIVKLQCWSARSRLLAEWATLPAVSRAAAWWVRKAGPEHYDEHLPRLRDWVAELKELDER